MTVRMRSERPLSIYGLLRARAEQTPEAIAIAAPGRVSLTYQALLSQVEDTVRTLNGMGLGRDARIAIVLPNGPEMAVSLLAVAAGAICVPLNPAYRANEFEFCLSDLRARALVVQAGVDSPAMATARKFGIPLITLTPQLESEAGVFTLAGDPRSCSARAGDASDEDIVLLLHTSGTTSKSKIVPLTHANICSSAYNIGLSLGLSPADRCLNIMPLFHIHGLVGALLSSLVAGGSINCAPGFHAPRFREWLEESHATWYTAVPPMHQAILARAAVVREALARCELRFVRSCSAPLPPSVMGELEGLFRAPVIEAYGMTEAAHQITSNPLPPRRRKPGSVGLPTGTHVAIMNPAGNLLPSGETGEIVIRGASVTQGYEGSAEANQNAFVEGWFRTGDEGYLDSEGYLFLTGRLKEMINRGGTKIAPREVDDVLLDHAAVAQAVTFAIPHPTLGEEVVAAVVLRKNRVVAERGIREFAMQRLADFKVPSRVFIVDEIPKGPSGKLQRIGLAERLGLSMSGTGSGLKQAEYVAPRGPLEKTLAEMWALVLGLQNIGVYDNFFQVGGDSILGTLLFTRVCHAMQVRLSLIRFFEDPTVAGQALAVAAGQPGVGSPSLVAIQPAGSKPPFFCVPAGVEVMGLVTLGRLLGPDQPFYALHPAELARRQIRYTPKSAAAQYLAEIRAMQPEGPYLLGGSCAGGAVALELAHQLISQGQQVAMVALIVPLLHGYFGRTIRSYWRGLLSLSSKERLFRVFGTVRALRGDLRQGIRYRISRMAAGTHPRAGYGHAEAPWDVQEINRRALRSYYARQPYQGRVTIFVTQESITGVRASFEPREVWSKLAAGGVDSYVVSGDHNSVLGYPHVKELAERLSACLDSAIN